MKTTKLTYALAYLCCLIPLALCSTTRHAKVRIENKSSQTLSAVRVRHAYGNLFKQRNSESQTWTDIAPGTATDASLIVEYLTGDPSNDWWQVGWTVLGEPMIDQSNSGSISYRQTSPSNVQGVVSNVVNQLSSSQIASGILDTINATPFLADFLKTAIRLGTSFTIARVVVETLVRLQTTDGLVGFKQCTLYTSDQDRIVNIRIYDTGSSGRLQISPADSSNCDTVWKLITVPWPTNSIF